MKKYIVLILLMIASPIIAQETKQEETTSNEILEYRYENYRAYASILNRFDVQGFQPFNQNSYVASSTLILEGHQKWWWKANVFFMGQIRVSFILNESILPIKDSFGFLLGLSGYLHNNISLLSGGKGTSVLMYGGVYFSGSDFEFSSDYNVIGPEIGIRVNYSFHKNVALTFGLDIGYHNFILRTPTEESINIFANYHGFMIGASIGFTFNNNYSTKKLT